jgi:hypothetical protein
VYRFDFFLCINRIPLPKWVVEEIDRDPDLAYTDKQGRRNYEYLSLGCDTLPVLKGRSPVQVYADYMRSFRDTFAEYMGQTIVVWLMDDSMFLFMFIFPMLSSCSCSLTLVMLLNFPRKSKLAWDLLGS